MFGLIGHSTSFEDAKRKASLLGFDHIADGDNYMSINTGNFN